MKSYKIVRDDSPLNVYNVLDRETGEVLGHVKGWSEKGWTATDPQGNVLMPNSIGQTHRFHSRRKHAVERVVREARAEVEVHPGPAHKYTGGEG